MPIKVAEDQFEPALKETPVKGEPELPSSTPEESAGSFKEVSKVLENQCQYKATIFVIAKSFLQLVNSGLDLSNLVVRLEDSFKHIGILL